MLDIKLIRENKDFIINNLKKRIGYDVSIVEEVLKIDEKWRIEKSNLDKLKSEKNKESKAIAKIKKQKGDIKQQLEKVKIISEKIKLKDEQVNKLLVDRDKVLISIPNNLDNEVPIGHDDEENVFLRDYFKKPKFDFKIKDHRELCELNNWYELDQASKNSGSRFYYLKNELLMLQIALYNYVLNKLYSKGYTPIETPPMLRKESVSKSVSFEAFEEDIYKIEGEDLYLIATSEPALAVLHNNETLNHKDLPIKYAGLSPCFRKEAGVTKDEKGIFRVHNFNKIEQFIFSKPEESDKLHEEITKNAEEIFQELEIHFRVVDICSGDIGSMASRKFDIEAWLPGQNKYREMVSASNYRDYGARRLNCKYQDEHGELKLVHTLNSTAIALTRTLIAIIENHQTKDGNVKLPKVLKPYFNNREYLINK